MPPKSYIRFKDAYYDDVVNPLSDSSEESLGSFIEEDEDEVETEQSSQEDEESVEDEDQPSSSNDQKTRSGRSVNRVKDGQKLALERLKSSREKAKISKSKFDDNQEATCKKSAKKSINFLKKSQKGSNESTSEDSDEVISPSKSTRKRQLSIIESSDEDDEEVIKSPSSKKKFNLSRIDSSPESDT